jgi:DNA polymerase (family 10)
MMENAEIIDVLNGIAALLRAKKESIFKIRAYEKVAKTIAETDVDVDQLARENRLKEIPGIGEAIDKKITELVNTGKLEYYEKLKSEISESEQTPD